MAIKTEQNYAVQRIDWENYRNKAPEGTLFIERTTSHDGKPMSFLKPCSEYGQTTCLYDSEVETILKDITKHGYGMANDIGHWMGADSTKLVFMDSPFYAGKKLDESKYMTYLINTRVFFRAIRELPEGYYGIEMDSFRTQSEPGRFIKHAVMWKGQINWKATLRWYKAFKPRLERGVDIYLGPDSYPYRENSPDDCYFEEYPAGKKRFWNSQRENNRIMNGGFINGSIHT